MRRIFRMNRRVNASPAVLGPLPHQFITLGTDPALTWVDAWYADQGVDQSDAAGRVRVWTGARNGVAFSQVTAANQPNYSAADSSLGDRATIHGVAASSHHMTSSINLQTPATANILILAIFRTTAWAGADCVYGSGAGTMRLEQATGTPQLRPNNASAGTNMSATLNTWFALEVLHTGVGGNDRWRLGTSELTGQTFGNGNPGNITLFARDAATEFSNSGLHFFGILTGGDLSVASKTRFRNWATSITG